MKVSTTSLACVASFVSTLSMTPAAAVAQPGFGRVANLPWAGGITVRNDMKSKIVSDGIGGPSISTGTIGGGIGGGRKSGVTLPRTVTRNLSPVLASKWGEMRDRMVDSVLKLLHERDVGGGFRTSRNRITISDPGPMFAGWDGRGYTLRFLVPGNRLSTYFRTPTPLGADFDPGFTIDFDLDVSMDVNVVGNQLVAGPARITPNVKPPAGRNFTGDFVMAVNKLIDVMSGADFVGAILAYVNASSFGLPTGLNNELTLLNPVLQAAAQGGVIVPGFSSGNMTLTIRDRSAPPVVR